MYSGGVELAEARTVRACNTKWWVGSAEELPIADLLLIGLVYHAILMQRNAAAAAAS